MFVGHYGPSFGLRRASGGVPLWVLFLAVQLVDVLWAILIMAGVEKVRITPGFTASSPLDLYYMPYTHSLAASAAWAVIFGTLAGLVWGRRGGVVVGLCVISHWILDLPVHVADLPLWGDAHKVGLGLWDRPVIAFALEAGVLFLGTAIYAQHARGKLAVWIFAVVMLAIQTTNFVMPPPAEPPQFAMMALSSYVAFAAAAWLVEKRWGQGLEVSATAGVTRR
ncbi:MAG: hypothetical protein AMJ62_05895 [Myxococcales bacterium SG8_38]|nr:MAG: hypothetical protein AMJ62_05895 [Myxococcales bacterium SG8_38]